MFGSFTTNGRVLIVDDEPDIRKVVRMTLEKSGYEVIDAEDGEHAIKVVSTGDNPLVLGTIITDVRMPKVNGIEAIRYFRDEYPGIPLIVLTGFPDLEMATTFLKQGIVDYLVKPVEKDKLKASVARAFEQWEIHRL